MDREEANSLTSFEFFSNLEHLKRMFETKKLFITHRTPKSRQHVTESARLKSFHDWPKDKTQKPEQLSAAGLFYLHDLDRVVCFSCGGGLFEWTEADDPWEEHTFWYSDCYFVKLMKSEQYIDEVKTKLKDSRNDVAMSALVPSTTRPSPPLPIGYDNNSIISEEIKQITSDLKRIDVKEEASSSDVPFACVICYKDQRNIVFGPCRHVATCAECTSALSKCPICAKPIEQVMKIFFV